MWHIEIFCLSALFFHKRSLHRQTIRHQHTAICGLYYCGHLSPSEPHVRGHHTYTQTLMSIVPIGVSSCKQQKTTVADMSRKGIYGKDKSLTYEIDAGQGTFPQVMGETKPCIERRGSFGGEFRKNSTHTPKLESKVY